MKAAICTKYGPPEVLKIVDIEKPKPKSGEVLIRVRASSVNSGDVRVRALKVDDGADGFAVAFAIFELFFAFMWFRTGLYDKRHATISTPWSISAIRTT